jgi:hypothetical protein
MDAYPKPLMLGADIAARTEQVMPRFSNQPRAAVA